MRLNKSKLNADTTLVFGCGQHESPNGGDSDAVTDNGRLVAYRKFGYPGTPIEGQDWDWVHKDFRK